MTRLLPEVPTFASEAEREVWERLRSSLPGDALLLANLRIVDEHKDHEADLVVLLPEVGVVVLEVKGGAVWYDGDHWWQSGGGRRRINPTEQALKVKYALREFVEADPRWGSRGHIAWAHGVVAPYSPFADDFAAPDCPRWMVHGRDDQVDLAERLEENARGGAQGRPAPTHHEVELISEILRGRGFTGHDLNAEALERQAAADRLTAEQAALLQVTRLLNRVEVRGGAGSGKTVLALTQAKQLTRGRDDVPPQRVAVLCYSIGLGQFLRRQVESWPKGMRPAFAGTFHELGRRWGAPDGDREDSTFWEEELPALMADLAADLAEGEKYDAIIVDEAQDFADSWWVPLLRALKDPERGGLYVYSDENQRIFARFGQPPVPLVPLVLDHNLRNTRQIHNAFGPLAPTRMTSRGGDGADVHFLAAGDDAVGMADDAVELLLEARRDAGQRACRELSIRLLSGPGRSSLPAMTGTKAGATADEIAKRHREKIARLERSAVQWEAGAAGERATGEVLAELQAAGWFVLHDLAWPGRQKANIDHLVVGPGGIFVIDTKNWSGSVEVRDGVLRQNGRSRESAVDGVRRAVAAVQPLVPDVPVQPVLSLHGDLTMQERAGGVILCSTSTLREMLESRPAVLEPADVSASGRCSSPPSRVPRHQWPRPRPFSDTARHGRPHGRGRHSAGWWYSC